MYLFTKKQHSAVKCSVFASPHFDEYRSNSSFAPRRPDLSNQKDADETEDLSSRDLVLSVKEALSNLPDEIVFLPVTVHETLSSNTQVGKYLWLVRTDDVKMALEHGVLKRTVTGGPIKHSNLTADMAHCGGELWFESPHRIFVNGGSGRFTPRSKEELNAIAKAFRMAGYAVCSFGWDEEKGGPSRLLRKANMTWL